MRTSTALLGIGALSLPSLVLAKDPYVLTCMSLVPEEPCFGDPESCYRAFDRNTNPWIQVERDLQPEQATTDSVALNVDSLLSCDSLAGVDRLAYRRCLAMKHVREISLLLSVEQRELTHIFQNPAGFADDVLGLSTSEPQSVTATNDTTAPANDHLATRDFSGNCCRITNTCYDILKRVSKEQGKKEFTYWSASGEWSKASCCIAFWYRSCDGQDKSYPGLWSKPPLCSNPKEWGPHIGWWGDGRQRD